ncbi:hypothetical protein [Sulfurimonas sp.]|uniref:hypothetical protein n=1 Tax=Sulfurimonas sp. TaxID=2022749 RepID=UPI0019FF69EC|nr:hypothetical protein [Sulfurimonas sp.]MBE0515701.1 hypothetical protein [Sulfurimonas sp.]
MVELQVDCARDSIGFDGGDTSLYGYVLNDPVHLIDPIGLAPFDWLKCWYYTHKISPYIDECNQAMSTEDRLDNLLKSNKAWVGASNNECFKNKDPELYEKWTNCCGGGACKK